MTTAASLGLAALYALGVLLVVGAELWRTRRSGPGPVSLFLFILLLQCGLPAIGIYGALPSADPALLTGNPLFDDILRTTTPSIGALVLMLATWFVVFFYVGVALTGYLRPAPSLLAPRTMQVHVWPLFLLLVTGLVMTLTFFLGLGDSWAERYASLILFRAGYPGIEHNAFRDNAFSLTQAWGWLSVLGLMAISERTGRSPAWWACLVMALVFAALGGSRRALMIPLLLAYFTHVLYARRWFVGRMVVAAIPAIIWLAYGEALIGIFVYGGTADSVAGEFSSLAAPMLRASSDVGITVMESIGSIHALALPPRLGADHLLALVRRLPDGMIGVDLNLPERIVRISTTALSGPNELDVPPGFMGQMWLDFRVLGPVVWGLAFGLVMGLLQQAFDRTARTKGATAVFALATFLVALPINSGTLDFNLSVDTMLMMLVLVTLVGIQRPDRQPATPVPSLA